LIKKNVSTAMTSSLESSGMGAPSLNKAAGLTNQLFVREGVFPAKNRTLQSYCVDKYTKIDQAMLVGEFFNQDDNGYWRVLGMRPRRTVGPCIEYDVIRLRRKDNSSKTSYLEGTEHILKLCDSDSPNDHLLFLQQLIFLREFNEAFFGHPQHYRFPQLLGSGAFDQLCYKDTSSNYEESAKLFMLFPRPHARPYFIVEKHGPTIEDLLHGNQFGIMDVSTARFIAIGCIQALRFMHELGYVHRCVTSYNFAVRVTEKGFMHDGELCKNIVCKDTGFVRRFRGVNNPPRRVAPFAGTYKYSSLAAMENKEQMPNDDLISVLYLFVEMVHSKLPWKSTENVEKIKQMKYKLQVEPPVVVDDTGVKKVPIDLRYLPRAFKLIETFNPFAREQYTVYRDICTILNLVAESNQHMLTETYIELDKDRKRGTHSVYIK